MGYPSGAPFLTRALRIVFLRANSNETFQRITPFARPLIGMSARSYCYCLKRKYRLVVLTGTVTVFKPLVTTSGAATLDQLLLWPRSELVWST